MANTASLSDVVNNHLEALKKLNLQLEDYKKKYQDTLNKVDPKVRNLLTYDTNGFQTLKCLDNDITTVCRKEAQKLNNAIADIVRTGNLIDAENATYESLLISLGYTGSEAQQMSQNAINQATASVNSVLNFKAKAPWIIGGFALLIISLFVYLKFIKKKK